MIRRLHLAWFLAFFLVALFFAGTPVFADTAKPKESPAAAAVTAPTTESAAKPGTTETKSAGALSADQTAIQTYLSELFEASKNANSQGKEKEAARGRIESSVDWNKIAEMCMGGAKPWNAQSPKNREEFSKLLREIIALTAYSRMSDFWKDTSYSFQKIEVKGSVAEVAAKFRSKKEDYILSYFLHRVGKGWRIYDLAFEDLKYSENIHEQIDAFLKEKSFAQLLDKLRKRKSDLVEDEKKGKKATTSPASLNAGS